MKKVLFNKCQINSPGTIINYTDFMETVRLVVHGWRESNVVKLRAYLFDY
jgi:hypothetical protein